MKNAAALLSLVILGPIPIMHTEHSEPAPPVTAPSAPAVDPVTFDAWSHVSACENGPGAWNPPQGPAYPDSLGISSDNWNAENGGTDLSPANQIRVAQDIEADAGLAGYVPDAYGCAPW